MRPLLSAVLSVFALVSALMVGLVALSLPSGVAEFDRRPEDLGLSLFWLFVGVVVFSYSTLGATKGIANREFRIGMTGPLVLVFIVLIGLLLLATGVDVIEFWIPGALVTLTSFAYVGLSRVVRGASSVVLNDRAHR